MSMRFRLAWTARRDGLAVLAALLAMAVTASPRCASPADAVRISVYATAGDIQQHLSKPSDRARILEALQALHVSRLFLEGRRGDEYVAGPQLAEVRDFFQSRGIECSGGIATVPGGNFGARQAGALGWLNWEDERTRRDVAGFFLETAPLFQEIIVDDFFCTADTSELSERARGGRPWGEYRRDLMVSLIPPLITESTRRASPGARLILKFPQWYDRFHLFGYDPARMPAFFDRIWVGTEVRDPGTRRMGYVQPTQGYVNFRWLRAVAGDAVRGAWFDHIECNAQHFLDQAYQSVLAGARELTLFRLGDVADAHPGDAALAAKLPELQALAGYVRRGARDEIAYYKPPGSDAEENLYLADYLVMLGLPLGPSAEYPSAARVAVLPVQAAADKELVGRMRRHLDRGARLVVTPALVRAMGRSLEDLAGVETAPLAPASTVGVWLGSEVVALEKPLAFDAGLRARGAAVLGRTGGGAEDPPWLTRRQVGRGLLLVLNARTFGEGDFRETGEWLLPPRELGLPFVPQRLADRLRSELLTPLGLTLEAPAGVGLYGFRGGRCLYNFRPAPVRVVLNGRVRELEANGWLWVTAR